jgi:hypothetical protein
MGRHLAWSVCVVLGCGGKAQSTTEPHEGTESPGRDASVATEDTEDTESPTGAEFPDDVEDADCFDGPSANLFEAEYAGDSLAFNGCDGSMAGPATVITVDGRVLKATAEIDSELDASYRVVARGYKPPTAGDVDALVLLGPLEGAGVVVLSSEELAAVDSGITTSYRLPATRGLAPPTAIVGVDVDGDGAADAAVVHACYRVAGGRCTETADLFVRRVADASWVVPYAAAP